MNRARWAGISYPPSCLLCSENPKPQALNPKPRTRLLDSEMLQGTEPGERARKKSRMGGGAALCSVGNHTQNLLLEVHVRIARPWPPHISDQSRLRTRSSRVSTLVPVRGGVVSRWKHRTGVRRRGIHASKGDTARQSRNSQTVPLVFLRTQFCKPDFRKRVEVRRRLWPSRRRRQGQGKGRPRSGIAFETRELPVLHVFGRRALNLARSRAFASASYCMRNTQSVCSMWIHTHQQAIPIGITTSVLLGSYDTLGLGTRV